MNYFAFNHDRPAFKGGSNGLGNVGLEKAINFAIDRHAILAQGGYLAGKRTDQILPPGMAGFRDANLYPLAGPNLTAAKKALATGTAPSSSLVYYTCNSGTCPLRAQIVQFDLKQIGVNLDVRPFARGVQFGKEGNRGEPFDIADEGWWPYADRTTINVLLSGDNITPRTTTAVLQLSRVQQADGPGSSSGNARYRPTAARYQPMSNAAPWAALKPNPGTFRRTSAASRTTTSTASTTRRSPASEAVGLHGLPRGEGVGAPDSIRRPHDRQPQRNRELFCELSFCDYDFP